MTCTCWIGRGRNGGSLSERKACLVHGDEAERRRKHASRQHVIAQIDEFLNGLPPYIDLSVDGIQIRALLAVAKRELGD